MGEGEPGDVSPGDLYDLSDRFSWNESYHTGGRTRNTIKALHGDHSQTAPPNRRKLGSGDTDSQPEEARNQGHHHRHQSYGDYVEAFLGNGEKYGIKLRFSKEEKPLGTCGPVSLLQDELTEPFFLMNGDILTTLDFGKAHAFACNHEADLVVLTKEIRTPFSFGKVVSEGDYLIDLEEKPNFRFEVLSGIYVLKPALLKRIPKDTYYGIDMLIKDMLAAKMKVGKYLMQEYWLDIGQITDFQQAQDVYKSHFGHLKTAPGKG